MQFSLKRRGQTFAALFSDYRFDSTMLQTLAALTSLQDVQCPQPQAKINPSLLCFCQGSLSQTWLSTQVPAHWTRVLVHSSNLAIFPGPEARISMLSLFKVHASLLLLSLNILKWPYLFTILSSLMICIYAQTYWQRNFCFVLQLRLALHLEKTPFLKPLSTGFSGMSHQCLVK